ncbi:O-antigen translocase [Flavobacteriaceae bacterium MHTCC 0001]
MRSIINYINNKVLVKIASLKTAAVLTRVIAGVLTSKVIAVIIGAEGLALVGNLRNFVASAQTLATLGFYKGIVKYINDFKDNLVSLGKMLSTVYYIGFFSTILVSFFCYFQAGFINDLIFPTYNDYVYVIKIFAIVLPFYALNMYTFSIMNGFSKYKILIIINILGQILSLSVALLLIFQEELDGALISVAISESLIFLITLVGIINRKSLVPLISANLVRFSYFKKLSSYSGMALFSAVILPLVILSIRSFIIDSIGYKEAGFWEAMLRISKYYLMLVSSLLGLYIIPRFSEISEVEEFKKEVFSIYKKIVPYFALGLLLIYVFRTFIVEWVFSEEFQPVEDLFLWQLLGDFIKVLSLIIAYQFLAKKMFWHYMITEAFLVIILYTTSLYFIKMYGVKGATIAHFVSYLMYYGVILLIFGSSLFGVQSDKNLS